MNIIQGPTQEKYRYYPGPNSGQILILSRAQYKTNINIIQGPTQDQYKFYPGPNSKQNINIIQGPIQNKI